MLKMKVSFMGFDKDALINYRVERAKETIEEAKVAIDNNKLFSAENRIYYAIFYIVSALALKSDFSTGKHFQLMGWFNKIFVKTKKVSFETGKIYFDSFEKRQQGDYEDLKYFTTDEVNSDFEAMLRFVNEIEKLIISE